MKVLPLAIQVITGGRLIQDDLDGLDQAASG